MKKLLAKLMIPVMTLGIVAGCSNSQPATNGSTTASTTSAAATTVAVTTTPATTSAGTSTLKDGTFEGVGKGNNGDIKLSITITGGKIEDIDVVDHSETPGLSDPAFERIPEDIMSGQTLAVDTITGATYSSKGILEAVEDVIVEAGGNPADFQTPYEEVGSIEVEKLTTDLVVVGGGAAGIAASLRADELGIKTILLEKLPVLGGAIAISGGNQVVTLSSLQKEAGVTDDSVQSMVDDFLKNGDGKNVVELLTLFAEQVGPTTDWLNQTVGIKYDMAGGLHKLAEYSHNRELAYEGSGPGFAKTARDQIEASDVTVYLETKAEELLTDGQGTVTGFKAKTASGKTLEITAKRVIMATGGYGNNKDLLSEELSSALYYGPESSTGDGIVMATKAGIDAATRMMEFGKRYPNGIEVSPGIAKSTIAGNIAAFNENAILVNTAGERVVNEKSSNRQILEVELEQDQQQLYLLMDEPTFTIFQSKLGEAGISESAITEWLKNNGSTTPHFLHADTLDELAGLAKMDAAKLKSTVERYNGFVKAGKDEDFGRPADFMKKELAQGPFYLVEQKPRFASTMGGLVVTTDLQVKNKEDKVIPGLYAAGEVVGGIMGDDSPSGANNAWALTSGKLAAEKVADSLK